MIMHLIIQWACVRRRPVSDLFSFPPSLFNVFIIQRTDSFCQGDCLFSQKSQRSINTEGWVWGSPFHAHRVLKELHQPCVVPLLDKSFLFIWQGFTPFHQAFWALKVSRNGWGKRIIGNHCGSSLTDEVCLDKNKEKNEARVAKTNHHSLLKTCLGTLCLVQDCYLQHHFTFPCSSLCQSICLWSTNIKGELYLYYLIIISVIFSFVKCCLPSPPNTP